MGCCYSSMFVPPCCAMPGACFMGPCRGCRCSYAIGQLRRCPANTPPQPRMYLDCSLVVVLY